ncbi:putative P-loop containing nucleoside triphosphate hydrolase protein [Lyophyllum shimeji]|uniref:P-loop containing nucleoside triphosphate hydrolase protein n=1 Tax=Lyophyllum shimeji TaxID=47721 RepID=A0A9P3PSV1_LYOSH|nr:putative P-loop containing nucleoside triphosphate hydrolase protein [Lyophyllum shimeji]
MSRQPAQTPRRSSRFLPLATPSRRKDQFLDCAWVGEPLCTRPTNPDLDLTEEDKEKEEADEDEEEMETVFYRSFEMKSMAARAFRIKTKGKKKQKPVERGGRTTYNVGDTVLIKTDEILLQYKPPSVGVILAMWETRRNNSPVGSDPAKMRIRIHYFVRPTELPSIRAKRDHARNEIYYTLTSTVTIYPDAILGPCDVASKPPCHLETKSTEAWSVSPSKRKRGWAYEDDTDDEDDDGQNFYCRLAINSQRGLYYDFNWDKHRLVANVSTTEPPEEIDADWGSGSMWDVDPAQGDAVSARKADTRVKKRAKLATIESESEEDDAGNATDDEFEVRSDDDEDEADDLPQIDEGEESDSSAPTSLSSEYGDEPKTPSKKRKRGGGTGPQSPTKRGSTTATPRTSRSKTVVHPTPHSKAVLARGKAEGTPSRKNKFAPRPPPLNFAAHDLSHLPKDPWLRAMHVLHVGSRPDALPCREEEFERVLHSVGELLEEGSGGCVYISGVPGTGKTATVHAVVKQLKQMARNNEINPFTYVEINGLKIPEPATAYSLLWERLKGHDVEKHGHLRIGAKESLKGLTKHFSSGGARGPGAHACVVLMDELDQLVTAKQDVVYNFFNWPTLAGSKLVVIAVANTMDLPERVMTGRVRSRLGMTRINFPTYNAPQLQQIVHARLKSVKDGLEDAPEPLSADAIKFAAMKVSGISGDARRVLDICRRTVELALPKRRTARVPEVKEVIQAMQNSPTAAYLRECSFHERVMLASLLKCIKREGVEEIKWGEVQHQHLIYMNVLTGPSDPTRKPTTTELTLVLDSLVASRAMLVEEGAAVLRKPEGERKVLLNLEAGEVERVLGEWSLHKSSRSCGMTVTLRPPSTGYEENTVNRSAQKAAARAALSTWPQHDVCRLLRLRNQTKPVNTLPPEILVRVFELAAQSSVEQDRRPWGHPRRRTPFPITVSHVSAHWRDLALNSPLLWTDIDISPPWSLKRIRLFLARSKTCLIHMNLAIPIITFAHLLSPGGVNASAYALCDAIAEHIPRCRRITLKGDFGQHETLLDAILKTIQKSKAAPPLDYLDLQIANVRGFQSAEYTPLLRHGAPLLTQLRVTSLMVSCLPRLERVTSLHLALGGTSGIEAAEFTAMVASCPMLQSLSLYDDVVIGPWPQAATIELPSLRSLHVFGTFASVSDLLRVVSAPLLEELVVAPIVGDDLVPFYQHTLAWSSTPKFSSVKSITLSPVFTTGFALMVVASKCFPAVERLTIPNIHPDSFHEIFTGSEADAVWPNLRALATRNVDCDRMRTLLAVVAFREAAGRPIETLYLDKCSIERVASMMPLLPKDVRVVEYDVWSMLHDEELLHEPSHFVGNEFDFVRY